MAQTLVIFLVALALVAGWTLVAPDLDSWGDPATTASDQSEVATCADGTDPGWEQSSSQIKAPVCSYPYGSTWPGDDQ